MKLQYNNAIQLGFACAVIFCAAVFLPTQSAFAARIKDLCEIQGARGNPISGIGLVVGLGGTGDKSQAAVAAQDRLLKRMDIDVLNVKDLKSDNTAVVMVTATLPAFSKEGTRIDIKVDSMYDCKSLEGGMLLETHLYGPGDSEVVFAIAQGPVTIGGAGATGAAGGGGAARKNHVTSGRVPLGAYVEHEAPSTITDGERLVLALKTPDFGTANNIERVISFNPSFGEARALGAGTVQILIPQDLQGNLTRYVAELQELEVQSDSPARIVINERTGTIVVGERVVIKPCQIAHGSLTIKIAPQQTADATGQSPAAAAPQQPGAAPADGVYMMPMDGGTSAGDVAQALNKLKIAPRDMISIFQALREAGSLEADLEVM